MSGEMIGDKVTIELFITLTILSYIIGAIQIYGYIKFNALKHLMIIHKRYPMIVKMKAIGVMIHCFIALPFRISYYIIAINIGLTHAVTHMQFLAALLSLWTLYFIINLEAARLWLISFDLNCLHSHQNKEWKSHIDHSSANEDWYIRNRDKWGNKKRVLRVTFVYNLSASLIAALSHITLQHSAARLTSNLFYVLTVCGITYIYYKCPKTLDDNLMFQQEFKRIIFICITAFLLSFINFVVRKFELWIIFFITQALLGFYALCVPSLLSTIWITRKIETNASWKSQSNNILFRVRSTSNTDRESTIDEQLRSMLLDENKFESFVLWMYLEFASESILSFIEFVQFKQYLSDNNNDAMYSNYALYENIPKSFIVFEYKKEPQSNNNMYKAHLLFQKYIEIDAIFEINISADARNRYIEMDQLKWEMNESELINVFDEVIDEMYFFMRQSFVRYLFSKSL